MSIRSPASLLPSRAVRSGGCRSQALVGCAQVRHAAAQIWTKIFVELTGRDGVSGPQLLLSPGSNFTPGRVDSISAQLQNLGELEAVELWGSSHARAAAAWHLDMIVVDDSFSGTRYGH